MKRNHIIVLFSTLKQKSLNTSFKDLRSSPQYLQLQCIQKCLKLVFNVVRYGYQSYKIHYNQFNPCLLMNPYLRIIVYFIYTVTLSFMFNCNVSVANARSEDWYQTLENSTLFIILSQSMPYSRWFLPYKGLSLYPYHITNNTILHRDYSALSYSITNIYLNSVIVNDSLQNKINRLSILKNLMKIFMRTLTLCRRNNIPYSPKISSGTLEKKELTCSDQTVSFNQSFISRHSIHPLRNIVTMLPFGCNSTLHNHSVYTMQRTQVYALLSQFYLMRHFVRVALSLLYKKPRKYLFMGNFTIIFLEAILSHFTITQLLFHNDKF